MFNSQKTPVLLGLIILLTLAITGLIFGDPAGANEVSPVVRCWINEIPHVVRCLHEDGSISVFA